MKNPVLLTCKTCGEVQLPLAQVKLHLYEGWSFGHCEFNCPSCGGHIKLLVDAEQILKLTIAGKKPIIHYELRPEGIQELLVSCVHCGHPQSLAVASAIIDLSGGSGFSLHVPCTSCGQDSHNELSLTQVQLLFAAGCSPATSSS